MSEPENKQDKAPSPPSLLWSLAEGPRASLELASLALAHRSLLKLPRGDGHPVLVLPGYGAGDAAMAVLRHYLKRWGYDAQPWKLGLNFTRSRITSIDQINAFRAEMEEKVAARIVELHRQTGQKVSVIGWSLGGLYASSMAERMPEHVRQAITLGTPFGDPRGTAAWNLLKRLNFSRVPEEEQDLQGWLKQHDTPGERPVHTTVIYSHSDGIVSPEVAQLLHQHNVDHIPVASSHTGFAFNPAVYRVIAETLATH